jgi:hypothetical protein
MTTAYTTLNSVPMNALPTTSGVVQQLLVSTTNPGGSTFAPDGLAAAPLFGLGGLPLQGGEMVSGGIATLVSYIGPLLNAGSLCWVLLSCDGGTQQVGAGIGSNPAATVGQVQAGSLLSASASGTANALSASIASTLSALSNDQSFVISAAAANTGPATLALTLGSSVLPTAAIVKGNNQALIAGDIPSAGYPIELTWSSTYGAYVMDNPAAGVAAAAALQIQPIAAAVAANALTLTLNPTTLSFRSATLSSGAVTTIPVTSAVSLVIPAGATLGTANAVQAQLVLVALDNAGTVELGVVNLAGGLNLDETRVLSTTAVSASASASNVVYSATARTNLAFRVVGYIDVTEATAGTWASAPTLVQGQGGQALAALQSIGYGQTIQNVISMRTNDVTYTNTTGRPIFAYLTMAVGAGQSTSFYIDGQYVGTMGNVGTQTTGISGQFLIPAGSTYYLDIEGSSIESWLELR